jgi:hypothetical protein
MFSLWLSGGCWNLFRPVPRFLAVLAIAFVTTAYFHPFRLKGYLQVSEFHLPNQKWMTIHFSQWTVHRA